MFYPNQPVLNETVYIVHCKHKDDNDESFAFNELQTCETWVRKHDEAHNGLDHEADPHGEVEVFEYKRVRQLTYEEYMGWSKK
jgi:G3E family GTPase